MYFVFMTTRNRSLKSKWLLLVSSVVPSCLFWRRNHLGMHVHLGSRPISSFNCQRHQPAIQSPLILQREHCLPWTKDRIQLVHARESTNRRCLRSEASICSAPPPAGQSEDFSTLSTGRVEPFWINRLGPVRLQGSSPSLIRYRETPCLALTSKYWSITMLVPVRPGKMQVTTEEDGLARTVFPWRLPFGIKPVGSLLFIREVFDRSKVVE